jgi:thiamine-monophosphate kinase
MKIGDLEERNLIEMIMKCSGVKQKADDCSIYPMDKQSILSTTDSICETTHIPSHATAYEAGRFFGAINLSDIAAMAAIPKLFMSSFNIRANTAVDYIEDFSRGLADILNQYDVENGGGDTKESKENIFAGFCIGLQKNELIRRRSLIEKNQILCLTGPIGRVGAAYESYRNGIDLRESSRRILDVKPRLDVSEEISKSGARFMMDLSDGLFGSLWQMKKDYGLGFRLVESEITLDPKVKEICKITGESVRNVGMNIGGDYELIFTIENSNYGKFSKEMEKKEIEINYIGDVWEGNNMIFDGEKWDNIHEEGWKHFKSGNNQPI